MVPSHDRGHPSDRGGHRSGVKGSPLRVRGSPVRGAERSFTRHRYAQPMSGAPIWDEGLIHAGTWMGPCRGRGRASNPKEVPWWLLHGAARTRRAPTTLFTSPTLASARCFAGGYRRSVARYWKTRSPMGALIFSRSTVGTGGYREGGTAMTSESFLEPVGRFLAFISSDARGGSRPGPDHANGYLHARYTLGQLLTTVYPSRACSLTTPAVSNSIDAPAKTIGEVPSSAATNIAFSAGFSVVRIAPLTRATSNTCS
jgi:hypothetical protein